VRRILQAAEARATAVITGNRPAIERLIAELEHLETLDRVAVAACLGERGRPAAPEAAPEATPEAGTRDGTGAPTRGAVAAKAAE